MANVKITELAEITAPVGSDLLPMVDDPAGTPASAKVTMANAVTKAHGLSDGIVKVASGTMTPATAGTDYYAPSGTDVAVADGGTGASTAGTARTNLGIDDIATKTSKLNATAAPTANDDSANTSGNGTFAIGSIWIDTTNDKTYVCVDATATAAVWNDLVNASGLGNIVEDTTPQLGGQLDVNGQALGDGTLELLKFSETASAVNELTVTNAATGNAPSLTATGDDTNIDLTLDGKGSGVVKTLSSNLDITGNIVVSGTVDGRDIATDGTKLDGIETGADVTDATNVAAAGAHMSGGTDVPVTDGGTGASTASGARTNLGLAIGTDVAAETSTTSQSGSTQALKSATTTVNVSSATAPTSGQVLTATSSTAATWQTPAGGGSSKPYGATYTIGTGGDYATLNAYVAATPAAGDMLYIKGAHTLTGACTISVRVHIYSSGADDAEIVLGSNNLTLSASGSTVEGVGFNNSGTGYLNVTASNAYVKNCYFSRTSTSNQYMLVASNNITVEGNRFDSSVNSLQACIYSSGSSTKVINNTINISAGTTAFFGAIHVAATFALVASNYVYTNTTTTDGRGIDLGDAAYAVINGNQVFGFSVGIEGNSRSSIAGNQIYNASTTGCKGILVSLANSVSGNHVFHGGASSTGIEVTNGFNSITGNVLYGTTGTHGVYIGTNDDRNVISSNVINGYTNGVNVSASTNDNTTIISNELSQNTNKIVDSGTATFYRTATDLDPLNQTA